jgi:hypothetical protein
VGQLLLLSGNVDVASRDRRDYVSHGIAPAPTPYTAHGRVWLISAETGQAISMMDDSCSRPGPLTTTTASDAEFQAGWVRCSYVLIFVLRLSVSLSQVFFSY